MNIDFNKRSTRIRKYTFKYDSLSQELVNKYGGHISVDELSLYTADSILDNGISVHIDQGGGDVYSKAKSKTLISISGSIESYYDLYVSNNNRWLMFYIVLYTQRLLSFLSNKKVFSKDRLVVSYDSSYHESDISQIIDKILSEQIISQDMTIFLTKDSIEYRLEFQYESSKGTPPSDSIKEYVFECVDKIIHLKKSILRV